MLYVTAKSDDVELGLVSLVVCGWRVPVQLVPAVPLCCLIHIWWISLHILTANASLSVSCTRKALVNKIVVLVCVAWVVVCRVTMAVVSAGAHGYFEVTNDVTGFTKAKFLNKIGKRTPVFARFSTGALPSSLWLAFEAVVVVMALGSSGFLVGLSYVLVLRWLWCGQLRGMMMMSTTFAFEVLIRSFLSPSAPAHACLGGFHLCPVML